MHIIHVAVSFHLLCTTWSLKFSSDLFIIQPATKVYESGNLFQLKIYEKDTFSVKNFVYGPYSLHRDQW